MYQVSKSFSLNWVRVPTWNQRFHLPVTGTEPIPGDVPQDVQVLLKGTWSLHLKHHPSFSFLTFYSRTITSQENWKAGRDESWRISFYHCLFHQANMETTSFPSFQACFHVVPSTNGAFYENVKKPGELLLLFSIYWSITDSQCCVSVAFIAV